MHVQYSSIRVNDDVHDVSNDMLNTIIDLAADMLTIRAFCYCDKNWNMGVQFPEHINKLEFLEVLYIRSHESIPHMPVSMCQLHYLREFVFSGNKLGTLPNEIGNLTNLMSFVLNNNRLRTIPITCKKLVNLINLQLYNNFIEDEGALSIADIALGLHKLIWLNLDYNRIKDGGCLTISRLIVREDSIVKSLPRLDLKHNPGYNRLNAEIYWRRYLFDNSYYNEVPDMIGNKINFAQEIERVLREFVPRAVDAKDAHTLALKETLPAHFTTKEWYDLFLYVFSRKDLYGDWGWDGIHHNYVFLHLDYIRLIKRIYFVAGPVFRHLNKSLPADMAHMIVKGSLSSQKKFSILTI